MRTVIIADDLTGACDTGVKMCGAGRPVKVYLDPCSLGTEEAGFAVTTNSRHLSSGEAYEKLYALAGRLKIMREVRLYKKIDSLFRGNVMAETDALIRGFGFRGALINAAVPENLRAVRDGRLAAPNSPRNGMSVIETAFRGKESECAGIPLSMIRKGSKTLKDWIEKALSERKTYLIADSETEEDLAITAEAVSGFGRDLLPVGAAGFIVPFIKETEVSGRKVRQSLTSARTEGPLLYVMGTNHPVTAEQIRYLKSACDIPTVAVRAKEILKGNKKAEKERSLRQAECALRSDPEAVLLTSEELLKDPMADMTAQRDDIAECCAETAAFLADRAFLRGLVVSGGTTAQLLLEKMGILFIELLEEFAPGVPVARIGGGRNGTMLIATKSGGFGEKEILCDLKTYL